MTVDNPHDMHPLIEAPNEANQVRRVILLGALFAAALLLIGTTIYIAGIRQDATQRANEERIVQASLAILHRSIASNLADYADWDDAVQHLAIDFDPAWARRNIGPAIHETLGYDLTLLLDAEDRPVYGQVNGQEDRDKAAALFGPARLQLASQARSDTMAVSPAAEAVIVGGESYFLAGAKAIQPEEGSTLRPPAGKPFVLLFARKLDAEFLTSLAADFGLAPLAFVGNQEPIGERASADLNGTSGEVAARLVWQPWQPGRRQLSWMLPALVGALLMVILFARLALHGLRLAYALRASEARLRNFAGASSDWWWETDGQGRFVWFSSGFGQRAKIDTSQLLGRTRHELANAVVGDPEWEAHTADLAANRPFYDFTYTLCAADGQLRTMRTSGGPVFDRWGSFCGYRGVGRDVTHEWQAAQRLRESEQRFRSLVENLRGIVFCHGVAGDGPHGYDQHGARLFGAEVADLTGAVDERQRAIFDRWYDAIHEADRPAYLAAEQARKQEGQPYAIEYRVRHPRTGVERWMREVAWIVDAAEDGRRYLDSYFIDITEEKHAILALRDSEVRLQLALSAGGMGTWDVDLRTGAERWNDVHYRLFGVDPASFIPSSQSFMALVDPRDRATVQAIGDDVLAGRTGPDFTNDYRIVRPDGTVGWMGGGGRLLRDSDGEPERLLGVSFEITERKERELALEAAHAQLAEQTLLLEHRNSELESANQAKSRFVASVSHEIRTPMNAVLGFADLLAGSSLTEAQNRYVHVIRDTGRQLLTLLNDILDIAKLEAGRLDLERIDFALAACLEQVRSLLAPQASERGLALIVEQLTRPSLTIRGDPTRLRQVLVNLVGNGLKFTAKGSVSLSVYERSSSDGGVTLRFEVRDTGIGIPQHRQADLFQAFVQADSSTTRHYGGSGLGLVICKSLVVAMGGTIGLESEPNRGSLFWFELPFEYGDAVVAADSTTFTPDQIQPLRVLVADDVASNRELLGEMLGRYGHVVLFAENGAAALTLASTEPVDVVLMDVQMPVMDGVEATRRIRMLDPPRNALPIFALSANVMAVEHERCLAAGMNLCLTKPVVWRDLFAALATVLAHSSQNADTGAEPGNSAEVTSNTFHAVPLLDLQLLTSLRQNIPEQAFERLIQRALAGVQDNCRRLMAGAQDTEVLLQESHRLRGTAGSFGLARLSALAGELEGRIANATEADELIAEMDVVMRCTFNEIQLLEAGQLKG